MQRYIEQLIGDIRQATWNLKPPHRLWEELEADPDDELELEDTSYIEQYIEGEQQPISQITGIALEQLPPPEKLTVEQRALLAVELEKLLKYFNFHLDFPSDYPNDLRYPFILDFWNEEHVALSFGENHIEFCDYREENCPFPGYCQTCKEIAEEMKHDSEHSDTTDFDFDVDELLPSPEQIDEWAGKQENVDTEEYISPSLPFFLDDDDDEDSFLGKMNGFYDDDGNKIEPGLVPVPGLCIICKRYQKDDWDENLLCLMNRNDQRNNDNFECGAFEN